MTDKEKLHELLDKRGRVSSSTVISDSIKVIKTDAEEVIKLLNQVDGIEAEQRTTDEFDIPPTAIITVKVDVMKIT